MTWLSRGIKAVGKATAFVSKATTNPIGAASDLLQSGGASKSGKPKIPTAVSNSTPIKSAANRSISSSSSNSGSGIMGWFRGTWRIFGMDIQRWVAFLILFIIIAGIFIWVKRKAKRAMGRRRTYAARRARAVRRRTSRVRRKK